MQRILNNPDNIVDEMLSGFVKCHSDIVKHVITSEENPRGVIAAVGAPQAGKVGVVTGGGSGHKPAFIGYVGKNMCDAAAVGEICSSPTALAFLEAFRAANGGAGVACLYGNYSGDNMNVKMAAKMAEKEGLTVKTVVANDDLRAQGPAGEAPRRGRRDLHVEVRRRQGRQGRVSGRGHRHRPEGHRQLPQRGHRPDPLHPARRGAPQL